MTRLLQMHGKALIFIIMLFIHSICCEQCAVVSRKEAQKNELHVKLFVVQQMELKCDNSIYVNKRSSRNYYTHTHNVKYTR